MIKVDIYEKGRFKGTLRVNNKWHGIELTEEQIRDEIETRLPTLKNTDYTIAFHWNQLFSIFLNIFVDNKEKSVIFAASYSDIDMGRGEEKRYSASPQCPKLTKGIAQE